MLSGRRQKQDNSHNQKHPFLTVEAGFVPVSNLNVGMHLIEGNGQIAIIEDWLVIAGSETMYNLTVQQDHTYTVGDGQFVVHNCPDGVESGKSNPLNNTSYTQKVIRQMNNAKRDFHTFPAIVDNFAEDGEVTQIEGGDGVSRTRVSIKGSYMNREGEFEYIIEPDNTINHRLFKPTR